VTSPYITKAEAAAYARVSIPTIERAMYAGELEYTGSGHTVRLTVEWVDEWLRRRRDKDRNGSSEG